MEFRDLKAQYRALQEEIDQALLAAVRDGAYIMGPQVQQLERELAAYVGVKHCIGCANGTDALTMVLMGWKIGPGDAVFVPDFTFFATGEVVSFEGAQPVFVDVDPDTFNLDAEKLEREILRVRAEGTLTPRAMCGGPLWAAGGL
ncbi:MAG: aminotransferase class I/II-fold pyridoxal phosphate-dependent enzyme [Oscillospiraceae bacterium]